MSDAEIEQAIRDAENYAAQDQIYRDGLEITQNAQKLLFEAENALKKAGKQLEKDEKKQIKADIAELRKRVSKAKPEKLTMYDISDIRSSIQRLEQSSARARGIAEREENK